MQDSESLPTLPLTVQEGDSFYEVVWCDSLRSDDIDPEEWKSMPILAGTTLGEAWEEMRKFSLLTGRVQERAKDLEGIEEFLWFKVKGEDDHIEDWENHVPAPGQVIEGGILPGGGGRGRDILKVVAIAAVIYFAAPYVASAIYGAGGSAKLAYATQIGLKSLAKSFLISGLTYALFKPDPPDTSRDSAQKYISGGGNATAPGEMVPILTGIRRYAPPLAAPDYEEYINGEQYWNFLYSMGTAPVRVEDIRLGNQPLSNYTDVEIHHDWNGKGTLLDFDNVQTNQLNARVTTDWRVETTSPGTDKIQLGFAYPYGLYGTDDKGRRTSASVLLQVQYRLKAEDGEPQSDWVTAHNKRRSSSYNARMLQGVTIDLGITGYETIPAVTRRVRESYRHWVPDEQRGAGGGYETRWRWVDQIVTPAKEVPIYSRLKTRGTYEVRVRRVGAEQTNTNRWTDRLDWLSMMSYQNERVVENASLPLTRLRVKASNEANGRLGHFNCVAGARIPVYDRENRRWKGTGEEYTHWEREDVIGAATIDFDNPPGSIGVYDRISNGPEGARAGAYADFIEGNRYVQLCTWTDSDGVNRAATRTRERGSENSPWGAWSEWDETDYRYQVRDPNDMFQTDRARIVPMNATNMPNEGGVFKTIYTIVEHSPFAVGGGQTCYAALLGAGQRFMWDRKLNTATLDERDWSDNPADLLRWCLTDQNANPSPFRLDQIDEDSLADFWEYCSDNNLTYSKHQLDRREMLQVWEEIANAGRGSVEFSSGKWGVVFDSKKPFPTTMFNTANSVDFQGSIAMEPIPEALKVRFPNRDKDWKWDWRIVPAEGFTEVTAKVVRSQSWDFVCEPDSIWALARHQLISAKYRKEAWTIRVPKHYAYLRRNDKVSFSHDGALIGQAAGYITSIDAGSRQVTLDTNVSIVSGTDYNLQVARADGTGLETKTVTGSGYGNVVNVDSTTNIQEGDLWQLSASVRRDAIIGAIKPKGKYLTLLLADAADHIHDQDPPPPFDSLIEPETSPDFSGPPRPIVESIVSNEDALPTTLGADKSPAILMTLSLEIPAKPLSTISHGRVIHVRWKPNTPDEIRWESKEIAVDSTQVTLQPVVPDQEYIIELTTLDASSRPSRTVRITHRVEGLGARPPDPTNAELTINGDQTNLRWDFPNPGPPDLRGFNVRFTPTKGVTNWNVMEPLGNTLPPLSRSIPVITQIGTYAVKAIDYSGNESENAAFVTSQRGVETTDFFEAISKTEAPAWTGTKSNLEVFGGSLILSRYDIAARSPNMSEWPVLARLGYLTTPAVTRFRDSGTYTTTPVQLIGGSFLVNLRSDVQVTSFLEISQIIRSWGTLRSVGIIGGSATGTEYRVRPQVRYSATLQGLLASDWEDFLIDDKTGVYFQFRILVETADPNVSPVISTGTFKGIMPLRTEQGTVTTPGTATFRHQFYRNPVVFAQGEQSTEYVSVEDIGVTSAKIRVFKNADNTEVTGRDMLWNASGYGVKSD